MGDFVKWNLNITAEHMDPYLVTDELYGTFGDQPGYFGYTHDCTKRSMLSEHGFIGWCATEFAHPRAASPSKPVWGWKRIWHGRPTDLWRGAGGGVRQGTILSRVGL